MLLVNIDHIPGRELEALGIVKGTVVQSKNFGKDFMAGMKTLVGGEIVGYTEMLIEARQIATKRMVDEAEAMGADAVVPVRASRWKKPSYPSVLAGTASGGSRELSSWAMRRAFSITSLAVPGWTDTPVISTLAEAALKFSYSMDPAAEPSTV